MQYIVKCSAEHSHLEIYIEYFEYNINILLGHRDLKYLGLYFNRASKSRVGMLCKQPEVKAVV